MNVNVFKAISVLISTFVFNIAAVPSMACEADSTYAQHIHNQSVGHQYVFGAQLATPDVSNNSEMVVYQTSEPPRIDGQLDDAVWGQALHSGAFSRFGGSSPISGETEAWLAADGKNIYVAFRCLDKQPDKIIVNETQRGGDLSNDDHVTVVIDSQNTRREISAFFLSARGTQTETLAGGTAANITWAGDWRAAVQRTSDGWSAEIAIPFGLLRYPRGTHSFGLLLLRKIGREQSSTCWPHMPTEGQDWYKMVTFLSPFNGLNPPYYAPRPVFLPYALTSVSGKTNVSKGIDIKYPLSTSFTGVATVSPDFRTVENDVASISFSYNEQFVNDRRPFFAEGSDYLPDTSLFYSQRIQNVNNGIKVIGKNGGTTVGALLTNSHNDGHIQKSSAVNIRRDIGLLSNIGFQVVTLAEQEKQSNQVGMINGRFAWQHRDSKYSIVGDYADSWLSGDQKGNRRNFGIIGDSRLGKPSFALNIGSTSPGFASYLGFVPELDYKGISGIVSQTNNFDRGRVASYFGFLSFTSFRRLDNSFYREKISGGYSIQNQQGIGLDYSFTKSQRQIELEGPRYRDHTNSLSFIWNQRSLFQVGGVSFTSGIQQNQKSQYISIQQSSVLFRKFSANLLFSSQQLGDITTSQLILTGTYRLSISQTLSGRLVIQDGKSQNPNQEIGVVKGINLYLGFSRRVRNGNDLLVLVGDPNSSSIRQLIMVKITHPYSF